MFRVQGTGYRVQGSGYRVQGTWVRVQVSGYRVQGTGCRVQGSGYRVQGTRFRVQGTGIRVQGPGFRVQGTGSAFTATAFSLGPGDVSGCGLAAPPSPRPESYPSCVPPAPREERLAAMRVSERARRRSLTTSPDDAPCCSAWRAVSSSSNGVRKSTPPQIRQLSISISDNNQ